jgi:hypothetical protein
MPKLRFLPATLFHNSCNFNRFAELDVSHNNHSPFASLMPPDQWPQKEDGGQMMLLTLKAIAAAAVFNNPWVPFNPNNQVQSSPIPVKI